MREKREMTITRVRVEMKRHNERMQRMEERKKERPIIKD